MPRFFVLFVTLLFLMPWAGASVASGTNALSATAFTSVLIAFAALVLVAMVGRFVAKKFNLPLVLGELLIGVLVGNIGLWFKFPVIIALNHLDEVTSKLVAVLFTQQEVDVTTSAMTSALQSPDVMAVTLSLGLFAQLGLMLLMLMVGLESTVADIKQVGKPAIKVAVVGVVLPLLLGLGVSYLFASHSSVLGHWMIAATLTATSVGITVRVLRDAGALAWAESRLILGAAVIDDVMGLVLLTILASLAVKGHVDPLNLAGLVLVVVVFIAAVLYLGEKLVQACLPVVRVLDATNTPIVVPLLFSFGLAWLAQAVGLAPIIGAFAAGLIMNERHFQRLGSSSEESKILLGVLETIFAPLFFVMIGLQVDLSMLLSLNVLGLTLALTVVAVLGKLACGYVADKSLNRPLIGCGMVARGEVGFIFASLGKALGLLSPEVFAALIMVVALTTLIAPLMLQQQLKQVQQSS